MNKKTKESIQRKIEDTMKEYPEMTVDDVAKNIKDSIRYTVIGDHDKFVEQVTKFDASFKKKGYKLLKVTNYYQKEGTGAGAYNGINAKYINPKTTKTPFEVQFHTEESLNIVKKNQPFYEIERNPNLSKKKRASATKAMAKNWEGFTPPIGASTLFSSRGRKTK